MPCRLSPQLQRKPPDLRSAVRLLPYRPTASATERRNRSSNALTQPLHRLSPRLTNRQNLHAHPIVLRRPPNPRRRHLPCPEVLSVGGMTAAAPAPVVEGVGVLPVAPRQLQPQLLHRHQPRHVTMVKAMRPIAQNLCSDRDSLQYRYLLTPPATRQSLLSRIHEPEVWCVMPSLWTVRLPRSWEQPMAKASRPLPSTSAGPPRQGFLFRTPGSSPVSRCDPMCPWVQDPVPERHASLQQAPQISTGRNRLTGQR